LQKFSLQLVFVGLWFDVGLRSQVDAEHLVVSAHYRTLGAERGVLQEDARPWIVPPVERRVGATFTVHFFLSVCFRWRRQSQNDLRRALCY
jgi:hypothetical protein